MSSCPSLATMRLNNIWASAFSPVQFMAAGVLYNMTGRLMRPHWPESKNDDIWTPLLEMLPLGHLATACCMILILSWPKFYGWILTLNHCQIQ